MSSILQFPAGLCYKPFRCVLFNPTANDMTLPMVTCPLCCRPGFSTSDSLCAALVGVTSRKLCCPICNEIVTGLDKFTIHLFGHSLKKFGLQTYKEPVELSQNLQPIQINDNNNNTSNSISKVNKKSIVLEEVKSKQLNSNLVKFNASIKETVPYKAPENTDWKLNNSNTHIQLENAKNILNSHESPLIYFRTDNGQIFALTQENLGPSLKNVTINTQNYITNTNITTSTLQTRMIEKVQKRKYNQVLDKEMTEMYDKGFESVSNISETARGSTIATKPPSNDLAAVESDKMSITREFESCRDLLTKGDFSTSTDDLIEACINKDVSNNAEHFNKNMIVDSHPDKKEDLKPKDGFSCDSCPFVFPNKTILAMHKQLIHKKVEVETESKRKMFVCNICPKSFKMRGSLMLHRRVAHSGGFGNSENSESSKQPPPKPACQVCGKFFKKEIHLSQHMKAHDEKQWQCTICAKTFTTKYFLKKHRRLHTGEMPYRCTTCSKAFTFQQSYHKHLLYHSDDKPYCCAQCGRLFKELSTLHNHERIHSGEKPFTCETCGKAFRQRVSYLVHRRIHTGVMPYKCTACNKSFRYKVSERTHKCTVQPPGVVVRTQANLVERLQAAMIKAAEKNEKKTLSEDKEHQSGPLSVTCSKSDVKSIGHDKLPKATTNSQLTKSSAVPDTLVGNKCFKDKPQYYLLVKGPNDESYYQPVIVPQITSSGQKPSTKKKETITVDKLKHSVSENGIEISIPESNSTEKHEHSIHVVLKSPESINSSSCSSLLNSPASNQHSIQQDLLYCSFFNSPKDKKSSGADNGIFAMVVDSDDKKIFSGSNKSAEHKSSDKKLSPVDSPNNKTSPLINNSADSYCQFLETTYPDKRKKLDPESLSDSEKTLHDLCNEGKQQFSPPPADILMDSNDIFSLILSPAMSSPSDKFGRLTLSPGSNPSTSFNICSFEKQGLLSDNINSELDMSHDPLFENISDVALKEFLFGSEINK